MSVFTKFDTSLKLEYLPEVSKHDYSKWKVLEPFNFYSLENRFSRVSGEAIHICVHKGFITDGATVPRIFWALLPPLGHYGQAAVLHDYCRFIGVAYLNADFTDPIVLSTKDADRIFLEAMKVLGVGKFKRHLMYCAVRAYSIIKRA
ncbi:MAG: DUF1353 domain-containing protein [Gammaproteobacteria bacterium]|nr:DUF1353 domain-containing protein [Acholeplasmataceae bacterium]MCK9528964.1 DUF1353 domain-containing protein [Gammaproteobacteria bacterium]